MTKYVLTYGYRRFSACQKLGWKKIPCYVEKTGELIELPLKDIQINENTRLNDISEGFNELMKSIKDVGLLQPIGVSSEEDLTSEEFITRNLTENIHRSDISPFEISMACKRLKELGFNAGQIAVRLSQPLNRIKGIIKLTEAGLHEELKKTRIVGENKHLKSFDGKIPFSIFRKISYYRGSDEDRKKLLEEVRTKELSLRQVEQIVSLLKSGMPLVDALRHYEKYVYRTVSFSINKEEADKYKLDFAKVIAKMLNGDLPLNKKLVYYKK